MAFTKTLQYKTTLGHKRLYVYDITTDGAEDNIATDLDTVDFCWHNCVSMTTTALSLKADSDSSGTASAGAIGASGATSGDDFTLFAVGR